MRVMFLRRECHPFDGKPRLFQETPQNLLRKMVAVTRYIEGKPVPFEKPRLIAFGVRQLNDQLPGGFQDAMSLNQSCSGMVNMLERRPECDHIEGLIIELRILQASLNHVFITEMFPSGFDRRLSCLNSKSIP